MEASGKRCVGIDLAKRTFVAKFDDPETGTVETFAGKTNEPGVTKFLAKLRPGDLVGMESCAFAFYFAKRIKAEVGCEVVILNPWKLYVIHKSAKKTDQEDAKKITWMLRRFPLAELPTVSIPTELDEHRRMVVSELRTKKRSRTRLINRLHSLFARVGITETEKADLKEAGRRLKTVEALPGYTLDEAERILEELTLLEDHIGRIEREMQEDLKKEPLAKYLMSVPGVGVATAMAFIAHVGDGSRFASAKHVAGYVGMTPRIDSSGEVERMGHITKRGCTAIRAVIVQAAWAAVHAKKPNAFSKKYAELRERRGKGRAIVAVARRLLEVMWIVTTRQEYYFGTMQRELDVKLRRNGLKDRLRRQTKKSMEPAA